MSVTWTETAADQLQAVRDHLARSSPGYAQALTERIVSRTEALEGQPQIGAEVPEYGDPDIREVFEDPYRIIYRVRARTFRFLPSSIRRADCPEPHRSTDTGGARE